MTFRVACSLVRNSKTSSGSGRKGSKRNLASYLHLEFVGKKLGDTLHSSVDRAKGRRAAKKAQAKRRAAKKAQESLRRQSVVVGDMMREYGSVC